MNVFIGLGMLVLGGISAGSSYVPLKGIRGWAWESLWAVQGMVAWLVLPLVLAFLSIPGLWRVLGDMPFSTLAYTWLFGFLWGLGGLAWGIAIRLIGLALGFSIATGFLSSLGTLVPILVTGRMGEVLSTVSGRIMLVSVGLSLVGIGICGKAGMRRDRERVSGSDQGGAPAFQFRKGVVIALVAGICCACFAFGISAGEPIRQKAISMGASPLWASTPVFFVELLGGITVNLLYCLFMNYRNKTFSDYQSVRGEGRLTANYLFSFLVGTLWYLQFVFYGMAAFYMGTYSYANWSVHMSFMVVASNLWGYYFKEWEGVSKGTLRLNNIGILVLVLAGVVMALASK
jgi:L-rhamnose-H+ transport protein